MYVKPEGLLRNFKIAHVSHHPVYFTPYIYILYYQSNLLNCLIHPTLLVTLIKLNILLETEVLEQPGIETRVHNVVTIRELRHANVAKQSKLLADVDVTPPRAVV